MKRQLCAALAALTLAVGMLAPNSAMADDRRHGGYGRGYDRHDHYDRNYYDRGRGHSYNRGHRHHDDNDDELAAGIIGLAIGTMLGAAIASPRAPQRTYAPPPRAYAPPPPSYYDQGYDRGGYYDQGYDRGRTCYRQERQWDSYAGRYLTVDIPYSC